MAQAVTIINFTTNSGTEISFELQYESSYNPSTPIDGGYSGSKEGYYSRRTIKATLKGMTLSVDPDAIRELDNSTAKKYGKENVKALEAAINMGATHIAMGCDGNRNIPLALSNYPADEIEKAWTMLEADTDDENITRIKAEQAAKETRREIMQAERILEKAESTKQYFHGKLPTEAEARAWRTRYNNIHNEGGEGYVPMIVTKAQVEHAEKIIAKHNTEVS